MPRGDFAWQVIEAVRRQGLTGELTLHLDGPHDAVPTRVYLRDGTVYFAERGSETSLGMRLIGHGVVTREQLHRGSLVVNGVEHLGRLFEREPSVDRGAVECCVEMLTDAVLAEVAGRTVQDHQFAVYRRHPAGVDRWLGPSTRTEPPASVAPEAPVVQHDPVAEPVTFADEVADAVRAVLEAIDLAASPAPRFVPDELTWSPAT